MSPYRDVMVPGGMVLRIGYTKRPGGVRATKRASLAYWAGRRGETTMAKAKKIGKQTADAGWSLVPSDLNVWDPKNIGATLEGIVTQVNPAGKFGLQVKVLEGNGTIWTLPAHKVLQGRLESVPGGCRPMQTILRVTFDGLGKSPKWPTPMMLYSVQYRRRTPDDTYPGIDEMDAGGAVPF